jgi:uncharacterized membrane protein
VWPPRLRRLTGICLIVMLLCVLPANVYAAWNRVAFGGHEAGPAYLIVRVPFQLFVLWWVHLAAVRRRAGTRDGNNHESIHDARRRS